MTHSTSAALRARIRSAQRRYPNWHLFASTSGHIYATGWNLADPSGRMGTTVDAPTTALIGRAIARREAEMGRMARSAARRAA